MIVSLKHDADPEAVRRALVARGLWVNTLEPATSGAGVQYAIASFSAAADPLELARIEGIHAVWAPASGHPRVDAQGPVVEVAGVAIGASARPTMLCGPCSIESESQIHEIARRLSTLGVPFLRGGAFKPRTSPYAFQGHGERALAWIRDAADAHGMRVVTEALSEGDVERVSAFADLVQIGSRNMQNFALLKIVGATHKPVLLKRAMSATVDEWLLAGEYLLAHGASGVVFCERGIRSFDGSTRNLLDLGAVALLAHVHRVPVIVDPSHGAGRRDVIAPLARASLAAGAAGVMLETHDDPGRAMSDGPQALEPDMLRDLVATLSPVRGGP